MAYSAARWRGLPQDLPAACSRLVTDLRSLKDGSGFTLTELAQATAISKSSWERYLNGKQFPPRHAVQALCKAALQPEDELLAQWALADTAWSGRGQPRSAGSGRPSPPSCGVDAAVLDSPPSPTIREPYPQSAACSLCLDRQAACGHGGRGRLAVCGDGDARRRCPRLPPHHRPDGRPPAHMPVAVV
ncbi:helix-turn-helix transcriptional regulator [Streptomyces sp. AK02-04a]|uniref:helix-turn-helix domain-containing protein n=1 Tax=Streptomyces sp. AK02-04a TaxID=3028649 RepID=UPI0029A6B146|nr:helix-turn-helix transcriptional regulator [Streptomyces sp. AK02-04a]MDX3763514.1 helix-turn-helix transcriptional regulator [Streptomyces sp. AK02-04a]